MRAVVGRPVTLTLEIDDIDGIPVDADGDVTLDILAGDGSTVILGAMATDEETTGLYTYDLEGQTKLDALSVTWNASVGGYSQVTYDEVRIVGNRILLPADIRADPTLASLWASERRVLNQIMDAVEDLFGQVIGFPVTLEGARPNFDAHRGTFAETYAYGNAQTGVFTTPAGLGFGFGGERLIIPEVRMPQDIYSLVINGATVDDDIVAQFRPGPGFLIWEGGRSWPSGNYEFWLTNGWRSVPGDIRYAAARLASYVAKRTPALAGNKDLIPERAVSVSTEGSTIVFSRIDEDHPTGIPDVDAVLFRYQQQSVI